MRELGAHLWHVFFLIDSSKEEALTSIIEINTWTKADILNKHAHIYIYVLFFSPHLSLKIYGQ